VSERYITVTQSIGGWFAVLVSKTEGDSFWELEQTGNGRYQTKNEAEVEAREWALAVGYEFRPAAELCYEFRPAAELIDNKYDPKIWQGTSNKHRLVARLPEGMDGVEALIHYAPDDYKRIVERIKLECADTFLRCHSHKAEGCQAQLTPDEWTAFKAAGGGQSW
jgi:hypothetical protein